MKLISNFAGKTFATLMLAVAALSSGSAMAQVPAVLGGPACNATGTCDSTDVTVLRGIPIVRLVNQERETPVVNNITNVTQQVTQVVQPNTYEVSNGSGGWNVAAVSVDCGGGKMLSGGGNCSGPGLTALTISQPNGNGWYARCDGVNDGGVGVSVYAVCSQ